GYGMVKSQSFGVQRLTRTCLKTILYELFVFGKSRSLQNCVSSVAFVIEKRMSDVLEMRPNLVRAAGFEFTFNQSHIEKFLQSFIMCNCRFPIVAFGKNCHLHTVAKMPPDVSFNRSGFLLQTSPNQRIVQTVCGSGFELGSQALHRLFGF